VWPYSVHDKKCLCIDGSRDPAGYALESKLKLAITGAVLYDVDCEEMPAVISVQDSLTVATVCRYSAVGVKQSFIIC